MRALKILSLSLTVSMPLVAEPSDTRLRILTRERLPEITTASYSSVGRWLAFDVRQEQVGSAVAVIRLSDFQVFTRKGSAGIFSPRGDRFAFQSEPKVVCLWTLPQASQSLPLLSADPVEKLCFSQDGKTLVAAQQHHQLTAWEVETQKQLFTTTLSDRVSQMVFSKDGKQLALFLNGESEKLQLRQATTGHLLSSRDFGNNTNYDAAFNHEGTRLFTLGQEALQEWTLPELAEARRADLPGMQTDVLRPSSATPAIHSSERGTLCLQTNQSTLLFDIQTFQVTREIKGTLQSDLAPDESKVWTVDSQGRLNSCRKILPSSYPVPS